MVSNVARRSLSVFLVYCAARPILLLSNLLIDQLRSFSNFLVDRLRLLTQLLVDIALLLSNLLVDGLPSFGH